MTSGDQYEISPPIIAFSDDIAIFGTLRQAIEYIEPWDIDSNRVFDSRGAKLKLSIVKSWTDITLDHRPTCESADRLRDELVGCIRSYSRHQGLAEPHLNSATSLDEAVAWAIDIIGLDENPTVDLPGCLRQAGVGLLRLPAAATRAVRRTMRRG